MIDYLDLTLFRVLWYLLVILWLVVTPLWLITMQRALQKTASPSAPMTSALVWLTMIPLFGLFWQFLVVNAVSTSYSEEFSRRGILIKEAKPGFSTGLSANILLCCALIPVFGILFALGSFIARIIHLIRIRGFITQMQEVMDAQFAYAQQQTESFDWEQYRQPLKDAVEEIRKEDPDRFKPKSDGSMNGDEERWKRK